MPHTRSEQTVSVVSVVSTASPGYAHHFAQVLQEPFGPTETVPRICVTVVGNGVLAEALTAALQGQCRQNRSLICLQFPPPRKTVGIADMAERSADDAGTLSHDIPVEVLVILSIGGNRIKPLLESPEVTDLRLSRRFGRRILLMSSDRDELSDLSLYPRWLRDCAPLCLGLDAEVETLLDAVVAAAGRGADPPPSPTSALPPAPGNEGANMARGCKRGSVSPIAQEPTASPQPNRLSEREKELALLAASGLSNAEIAHQLSLSLSTVKWHLQRVFTKLKIERRSQLAHLGIFP